MSMKFLADNGGLQALIQAIKDMFALFDHNKQNKLVAGRGITINQSTRVISSDGEPNVQADWDMATSSAASYIRNKPDIYTKREIDSMFSATITFVRVDELPAVGTNGTVYLVPKQGAGTSDIYDEYLWLSASGSVEAHYELIGSTSVDLSNYYTKSQTDTLLGDKVDKESGKGLSTNDYTTAEKTKLSGIEAGAKANVQSDWNQGDSTKDDFIKNKPSVYTKSETDNLLDDKVDKVSGKGLSTEDFTTSEKTKLSNIEAGAEVNVQSDWNQSDNTKDDYIKNKPTLRQPSTDGTSGQYLKSNGSGNAPSWETMDSSPTENSTNPVTSGGVKTALDGKQASVTITTNANTPTDNDTVIMQDNGNTSTTSFLRRKLSTLWEYFKKKPYGEAYLVWGGKNHNANLSPIDANLISEARANRLARYPIQYIKIEDSRDDGATWTENTSITDSAKHILVTDCAGNASNIRIGGSSSSNVADEHCKTRITFTTHTGSSSVLYARIEKICLWIETNGTTGNTCTVLGRLQSDVEADNDVWVTLGGPATLGGWSDWNVIQTDFTTYGNQNQKSTQYGQFRLLFECTGHDSVATRAGLGIQKIRAYGMRCWSLNINSLAQYNSFFAIDSSDNATFPANVNASNVTATKHITSGGTTNQMVAGNGDLKDIAETCKTAVLLNGGKYGFRIISVNGEDYTYLIVLADVTGVYDGTITNKLYGIQGLIFMQRDGSTIYNNLVGRITATASYSSSYVRLYTDVVQSDVVKPCVIKKDGRWLLCLSARGNNGAYYATSIIFFGRAYELADEPFTKIRVDSTFTHYYDGGAEIEYIKQASRYPLWASFGGNNTQFVLGDGTLQSSPIPIAKGGTGATTAQSACNAFINALSTGTATPTDSDYYVCQYAGGGTSTTTYHRRPMSALWNWIKTHFDSVPTSGSGNGITSGGVYSALGGYFPLAGKKAITGVYKNAPSFIHNVDFGNTSTEGVWRKFCVISTRQTYRNAVGEIHINARSTQGTIYLTIGSSGTFPQEGENNTLSPSVKYLSFYNDYRPVYWRVNDDNELELWWKATQYYDSVGVTGVNFSPYFLSLGSDYNAGVNVQWTNVVSLEAPANLSQAQDVSLTTLDVSAGDVLTIDGDNYQDYLRTPSGGIPTSVLEADRIVLPRAYSTIFFDTNYTATISYILGATGSNVQKNGRRITVAGNWKPREESSGDGRFTQYLYRYRGGVVGSQFADRLREAYEDFVYFNGIWYSKGY